MFLKYLVKYWDYCCRIEKKGIFAKHTWKRRSSGGNKVLIPGSQLINRTLPESALQEYKIKVADFGLRYVEHLKIRWFNIKDTNFWSPWKKSKVQWALGSVVL